MFPSSLTAFILQSRQSCQNDGNWKKFLKATVSLCAREAIQLHYLTTCCGGCETSVRETYSFKIQDYYVVREIKTWVKINLIPHHSTQ